MKIPNPLHAYNSLLQTRIQHIYDGDAPNPNPVAGGSGIGRNNIVIDPAAQNAAAQLTQKFSPTPTLRLNKKWSKFPNFLAKKEKTLSMHRNSSPELMNVKSPMTGTAQPHLRTSGYVFEAKVKTGYLPLCDTRS